MFLTDSAAAEEEGRKKDEKGVKFSSQVSTKKDEEDQEVFVDERKLMYASCICMYVCTKNNQPALVISRFHSLLLFKELPLSLQGHSEDGVP